MHGPGKGFSRRLVRNKAEDCHGEVQRLRSKPALQTWHRIAGTASWLSISLCRRLVLQVVLLVRAGHANHTNLYSDVEEPNSSASPIPTAKEPKFLAPEDGSDRTPKRTGHRNEIAEGLWRSPSDSTTSGGRPPCALGTIVAPCLPRPTPRPSSWEKLSVSTDVGVVHPLPLGAALLPGADRADCG